MGNQLPKLNQEANTDNSVPPPRPLKPAHLQGQPIDDTLAYDDEVAPGNLEAYETVDLTGTEAQSESMPLNDLINKYGSQLPLRFCVSESLYGICEDGSLMEGQLMNALFQKETKVVDVIGHRGAEYIVPLNSSLVFNILYNPQDKIETAKKGYLFSSVSDLMDASPIPQAVAVKKAFQCYDNDNIVSVSEGQVLIILNVEKCDDSITCARKLKCFMIERNATILIDETTEGAFSTNTSLLKVRLAEIIEYISLPVSVVLENSPDQKMQLPLHATVGFYTITSQETQKSVVVSSKYNGKNEFIEILLSVPIEAHLVKTSQQQLDSLRKQAKTFYSSFHPSKLDKVIVDTNSSTNYIQTTLFKVVPEDDTWMHGIDISRPHPPSAPPSPVFQIADYDDSDSDDYEDMSINVLSKTPPPTRRHIHSLVEKIKLSPKSWSAPSTPPNLRRKLSNLLPNTLAGRVNLWKVTGKRPPLPLPQSHSSDTVSTQWHNTDQPPTQQFQTLPRPKAANDIHDPVPYLTVWEARDGSLKQEEPYEYVRMSHNVPRNSEMEQLKQKLSKLENTTAQLTTHIKELTEESAYMTVPDSPSTPTRMMSIYDTNTMESNRKIASTLTCQELLEILECAGLGQYKESFEREEINGSLFIDLDEEILEKELDVKSKIHRIRIMRLVTGKQSVIDVKKNPKTTSDTPGTYV